MIDPFMRSAILIPVAAEDRALLKSNPSACSDAEAPGAPPGTIGMRPYSCNRALAPMRKTSGFGAEPQDPLLPPLTSICVTYVTIYQGGRGVVLLPKGPACALFGNSQRERLRLRSTHPVNITDDPLRVLFL
jgi:hypothetical protein